MVLDRGWYGSHFFIPLSLSVLPLLADFCGSRPTQHTPPLITLERKLGFVHWLDYVRRALNTQDLVAYKVSGTEN